MCRVYIIVSMADSLMKVLFLSIESYCDLTLVHSIAELLLLRDTTFFMDKKQYPRILSKLFV